MAEKKQLKAMISSTSLDLPEHRKEVLDACSRMGVTPLMMEHLPALDADAIEASIDLVNQADIYIGIFAHRYGYIPTENNPDEISITEMEYNRAVERPIPRFIFFVHDDHPIKKASEIEKGVGGEKLDNLKKQIGTKRVASFFKSPEDLRGHVISTLVAYKEKLAEKEEKVDKVDEAKAAAAAFHNITDIPKPPEVYVAHPYTLLQTHGLVGRQDELNLLTDWVANPKSDIYKAHILSIVAIGGMGKSALTWKWFNDIAPEEMKPLAGRMWWSFYESDASFENFIIRALAYVSKRSIEEIQRFNPQDRETRLLNILDKESFLFVLDGLERILIAYSRMDAAHLSDDDYDKQTANFVAQAYGLPESATQSFTGEHRLRKTADPRAGAFLRKLSTVDTARILISTRLDPADIQTGTGSPFPGCNAIFLPGLSDNDALDLWRGIGVTGSRESLLPIFRQVGNHPLVINALASKIAKDRRDPGRFDLWKERNPDFNLFSLSLVQAKSHVLEFALRGLDTKPLYVLQNIAAFRAPAQYDTLAALLIGKKKKQCKNEQELDEVLNELEDRGLVGWDKRANRYDLHPIVRGVIWNGLGNHARQGVYTNLHAHFEAVPMIDDYLDVNSLEDLTPAIELYNTLIGLGRYDDAFKIFHEKLSDATLYRLSAGRQRTELLEMLFPDGTSSPPRLNRRDHQCYTLNALSQGYRLTEQPGRGCSLTRRAIEICREIGDDSNRAIYLSNLSNTLRVTGSLQESEGAARHALEVVRKIQNHFQEAVGLYWLGLALSVLGEPKGSEVALFRSLRGFVEQNQRQSEGLVNSCLAQRAIWFGEPTAAYSFAERSWELAGGIKYERDFIRAARLQGEAALGLGDLATADKWLHHALTRARAVNFVEEELPALTALAELKRRQGEERAAEEFLDNVWEYAERGPYPLFHADALNVLAQIERDAGNTDKAIEAATKAYELAWCDGPPYAYHWGLIKAQKHLEELGAPLPEMPPFDESRFEPMPDVEIDPDDEFHVGESS